MAYCKHRMECADFNQAGCGTLGVPEQCFNAINKNHQKERADESELSGLLADTDGLCKPDYHKLNKAKQRTLHGLLCAYAKHVADVECIGWDELGEILMNAICEEIGDDKFCKWSEMLRALDS